MAETKETKKTETKTVKPVVPKKVLPDHLIMIEWEKPDGTIIRTNALKANIEMAVSLDWKQVERT